MKYIFILGSNSSLSIAELLSKINYETYEFLGFSSLLIDTKDEIDPCSLIKLLGGTIKIAKVQSEVKINDREILKSINDILPTEHEGKFKFGFSFYGSKKMNIKRIAMETKKKLKSNSVSCRWVVSKENTLSSVVVGQNKLDSKGLEVVMVQKNNMTLIAKTIAVQDYKTLSFRDYNRPARDDKSGMLPPKLAQILINLASTNKKNEVILDPFCGSGTVLMEAILMGYSGVVGADLSQKAIDNTRTNTEWVLEKFKKDNIEYILHNISATELSKKLKKESIDAIATEPYLGPQRGRIDVQKVKAQLENLYSDSICEFSKVLKTNGKVSMVWPVFNVGDRTSKGVFINPIYSGFEIINPLPVDLQDRKVTEQSPRNTIIYGRSGQRVWREIVVMKKK